MAGDRLVQADHADLLRALARDGARAFYEGDIAETMAADIERNGGSVTAGDLLGFHAEFLDSLESTYRGMRIVGAPRPFGGSMVARALATLDRHNVAALGHGSTEMIALLASAIQDAGAERAIESADTTQLCVVDGHGNAVSLTHSLGSSSGVVTPTLGFLFNNYLNCFNPLPGNSDSLAPGAHRESSMAPTIVISGDGPTIVTGSPGATRIPGAVVQVLVNTIDFGMSAVEAVSAPRIDCQGGPIHIEGRIGHSVSEELERLGREVVRHPANYDRYFGRPQVLARTDLGWEGAADPRGDGAGPMFVA
jgi:gamma-glutamyltranspeptidase/glutathione hydrolase